jgi:hypothetical protein
MVFDVLLIMVKHCILNKKCNYWLLSNALQIAYSINAILQYKIQRLKAIPIILIKRVFKSKFQALQIWMMGEVHVVLTLFLSFVIVYNPQKAHNMFWMM